MLLAVSKKASGTSPKILLSTVSKQHSAASIKHKEFGREGV